MILNMVQCGVLSPASFFHIRSDFQRHIIACSSAATNNSSSSNTLVDQQDTTNSNSSRLSAAAELCSVREKREPAVWETEDEPPALVVNPGKSRPQRSRPTTTSRGCGGQGRPAGGQLLVFGGGSPLLLSPKRGGSGAGPAVRCLAATSGNNNVMRGLWGPPDDKEFANFIRHVTNRVHLLLFYNEFRQFYGSAEISVVVSGTVIFLYGSGSAYPYCCLADPDLPFSVSG
jgi:hypothetical protein